MKISINFIIVFAILFISILPSIYGQKVQPPVPLELFIGNDDLYYQVVLKKKFTSNSRFNFFSVATFTADYKNELGDNRMVIPAQVSCSFNNGLGIMAGTDMNSFSGFSFILGPQYNYISRKFLAVSVVSFFLNDEKDVKLFGLYEYKPTLTEKLTLYSRLQYIYNYNMKKKQHNRSYLYLRLGLKKNQMVVGIGANLDQFGSNQVFKDNYGLFFRWELQ